MIYHAACIKTNQYYNYVYNQLYQEIKTSGKPKISKLPISY